VQEPAERIALYRQNNAANDDFVSFVYQRGTWFYKYSAGILPWRFFMPRTAIGLFLKFESTMMANKKSTVCLLSPTGSNAFFEGCTCADAQEFLFSGRLPQKVLLY
jgi:hypothetical protein